MSKRKAIDAFFKPAAPKKLALDNVTGSEDRPQSDLPRFHHETYPFSQPYLPRHISTGLSAIPAIDGVVRNDQADLDLLSFSPLIPRPTAEDLFQWLRQELFFYRVKYSIQRGSTRTDVATPR